MEILREERLTVEDSCSTGFLRDKTESQIRHSQSTEKEPSSVLMRRKEVGSSTTCSLCVHTTRDSACAEGREHLSIQVKERTAID